MSKMTVAKFLTIKLNECDKKQREVATELGYDKANIITMFKTGATKLPVASVGAMARALGVAPVFLLRLTFREYYPETFNAIEHALGGSILTANENRLLALIREYTDHADPVMLVSTPSKTIALVIDGG